MSSPTTVTTDPTGFKDIPEELRALDQWICWRWQGRDRKKTKVPISPRTGTPIDHLDPDNQRGFEKAVRLLAGSHVDGVGFVFTAEDPFCGVDLDDVLEPESGEIEPWAQEIIERLNSYTEISPSGTGLKIIVRGSLPGGRNRRGKIEMYDRGRFFTITGRSLPGRPATVEDRDEALAALYRQTFGDTYEDDHDGEISEPVSPPMEDDEIITKIRASRQGEKFAALYDGGDTSGHGDDRSSADLALVGMLAFYSQDPEQIDRLFRDSALMRSKWEREDYRRRTIRRALRGRKDFYGRGYDPKEIVFVEDDREDVAPADENHEEASVTPTDATDVTDAAAGGGSPQAPPKEASLFPVGSLPPTLRSMVQETAASVVCPPEFVALPALATLGSAVGASRALQVKGGWREFASFFVAVVAPPGAKKTPAMKAATRPAWKQQGSYRAQHDHEIAEHDEERRSWEAKKRAAKKDDVIPREPEKPKMTRTVVQDTTIEALAVILGENPRGVLVAQDEISAWVRSMDQYKGGRGSDRQFWLSAWSSAGVTVDRKSFDAPIVLPNPVLNVSGSIQPGVLSELSGGREDGLLDRFLICYPDPMPSRWSDAEVSPATELRYHFLYDRLHNLKTGDDGSPKTIHFTPEGKDRFVSEVNALREEMERPGFPEALGGAFSKMESALARTALLFSLVRAVETEAEEEVVAEDVERAVEVVSYFKAHARRVHVKVRGETKDERLLRALDGFLDDHGGSWKGPSEELRKALLERGVHDVPDRAEDLTARLLKLSEEDGAFLVKRGWKGKDRAVTVSRKKPQQGASATLPAGTGVGNAGNVGASNAADLMKFALKDGPLFPDELRETTGLAHGTIKKVLSELRKSGEVEDTGETRGQSRQVRIPAPPDEDTLVAFGLQ